MTEGGHSFKRKRYDSIARLTHDTVYNSEAERERGGRGSGSGLHRGLVGRRGRPASRLTRQHGLPPQPLLCRVALAHRAAAARASSSVARRLVLLGRLGRRALVAPPLGRRRVVQRSTVGAAEVAAVLVGPALLANTARRGAVEVAVAAVLVGRRHERAAATAARLACAPPPPDAEGVRDHCPLADGRALHAHEVRVQPLLECRRRGHAHRPVRARAALPVADVADRVAGVTVEALGIPPAAAHALVWPDEEQRLRGGARRQQHLGPALAHVVDPGGAEDALTVGVILRRLQVVGVDGHAALPQQPRPVTAAAAELDEAARLAHPHERVERRPARHGAREGAHQRPRAERVEPVALGRHQPVPRAGGARDVRLGELVEHRPAVRLAHAVQREHHAQVSRREGLRVAPRLAVHQRRACVELGHCMRERVAVGSDLTLGVDAEQLKQCERTCHLEVAGAGRALHHSQLGALNHRVQQRRAAGGQRLLPRDHREARALRRRLDEHAHAVGAVRGGGAERAHPHALGRRPLQQIR
eukprot:scaffold51202_cov65-Phaeocystis_antarctica.AAC.5